MHAASQGRPARDDAHLSAAESPVTFGLPAPQQQSAPRPAAAAGPSSSSSSSLGHQQDALTLKAMTHRFYTWFRDSGMLSALQTQFRAQIIQQIPRRHLLRAHANQMTSHDMMRTRKPDVPLLQRVANSLIAEYLLEFDYPFTLSIFGPESGTRSEGGQLTRDDMLSMMRITGDHEANQWIARRVRAQTDDEPSDEEQENDARHGNRISIANVREAYDSTEARVAKRKKRAALSWTKKSLLAGLIDSLATQPNKPAMFDSICQTDEPESATQSSIDHKLKRIDDDYLDAHLAEREALFPTLQEKMLKFERETQVRFQHDLELEKRRFADQELARMRLEERQKYRADEEKLRRELRAEADIHLNRVRKEQEEVVAKYQLKERTLEDQLFRERQALQENMNLLHNREIELARKREVMEKTQLLAESKIRESDRLLTTRATELEYLAKNLAQKIKDETERVRKDWEGQVHQRDELLVRVQDTLASTERRLASKSSELSDVSDQLADHERRLRSALDGQNTLEAELVQVKHIGDLAAARVAELDARRRTLEEAILTASAKEQVCTMHQAELTALRQRVIDITESAEERIKQLREKHGAELTQQDGLAQTALQLAHAQTTSVAQQWKSSYSELLEELERKRADEESLRQSLEEQTLITTELKRDVMALRAGGARPGYQVSPAPTSYVHASLAHSVPAVRPAYEAAMLPSMVLSASTRPSVPIAASISPAAPLATAAPSAQTAQASLDAEFFSRESALEAESAHLAHQLSLHSALASAGLAADRREQARAAEVTRETDRHLALTAPGRDYALAQSLPPAAQPTSASEAAFSVAAAQRDRELADQQRQFLERAREEEARRRAEAAQEDLARKQRENEWEAQKAHEATAAYDKQMREATAAAEAAQRAREAQQREAAQQAMEEEMHASIKKAREAAAATAAATLAASAHADAEAARQRERDDESKSIIAAASAATFSAIESVSAAPSPLASSATVVAAVAPAQVASPASFAEEAIDESSEDPAEAARRQEEEAAQEAMAARLRLERERTEQAERDRDARLQKRQEERAAAAAAAAASAAATKSLAPTPSPSAFTLLTDAEKAEAATREFEAEKQARRAALRLEEALARERKEREEAERQAKEQQEMEAAAAAAAAAAQPSTSEEPVYDEALTRQYYEAQARQAAEGYYADDGNWVSTAGAYDPNYAYDQYGQYVDQYDPNYQQYEQGYAPDAYAQPAADGYTATSTLPPAADVAPPLPVEHDDISEASAEFSAPTSDVEEF